MSVQPVVGEQAKKLLSAGAILLDVRSPEEFGAGHLQGAKNVPVGTVKDVLLTLPKDKPIVVYCAAGGRATRAATELSSAGFSVYNLGSMSNWEK